MNKATMIIWGMLIFLLWSIFLLIAYNEQDKEYMKLESDLKYVTARYLDKKNIKLDINETYKVFITDLEEEHLINDDTKIKEYCVDNIVVTRNIFRNSYLINKECKEE